jgi:hypothetical protein
MQNAATLPTTSTPATQPLPTVAQAMPAAPQVPAQPVATPGAANTVAQPSILKGNTPMKKTPAIFIALCLVAILAGTGTGIGLKGLNAKTTSADNGTFQGKKIEQVAGNNVAAGQVFGSANEADFHDSAEGYLEAGGLDGEGSHHLLRAGGPSQTVYLTSSVTDLTKFEGMQIKVWGDTFKAQKAGWLMDVGRVQVVNLQGSAPTEE